MSAAFVDAAPADVADFVQEYSAVYAGLAALRGRFAGVVFDLATTEGDKLARAGRLELVRLRGQIEARRVEVKAPVLKRGKLIDSEAARITAEIIKMETPIDEQIKADERRRAAEALEQKRIEAAHRAECQARIDALARTPMKLIGASSDAVRSSIILVTETKIGAEFGVLVDDGMAARARALETLNAMLLQAINTEAMAAALADARAAAKVLADAQAVTDAAAAAQVAFDAPAVRPAEVDPFDMPAQPLPVRLVRALRPVAAAVVDEPVILARRAAPVAPAVVDAGVLVPRSLLVRVHSVVEYFGDHDDSLALRDLLAGGAS